MLSDTQASGSGSYLLNGSVDFGTVLQGLVNFLMKIGLIELDRRRFSGDQFDLIGVAQFGSVDETAKASFRVGDGSTSTDQIGPSVFQSTGSSHQLGALGVNALASLECFEDLLSFQEQTHLMRQYSSLKVERPIASRDFEQFILQRSQKLMFGDLSIDPSEEDEAVVEGESTTAKQRVRVVDAELSGRLLVGDQEDRVVVLETGLLGNFKNTTVACQSSDTAIEQDLRFFKDGRSSTGGQRVAYRLAGITKRTIEKAHPVEGRICFLDGGFANQRVAFGDFDIVRVLHGQKQQAVNVGRHRLLISQGINNVFVPPSRLQLRLRGRRLGI